MTVGWRASRPVYLLHIPKTAGTSVTGWLTRTAGPAAVCPAKNWDQLVALDGAGLSSYRVFCGHFGIGLEAFLGRRLRICTVLRDPVERTVSHYRHVRRDPAHPRHPVVSAQSFAQFLADPDNRPMIDNFQARYLLPSPLDFRPYAAGRLDRAAVKANRLSTTSEDVRCLFDQDHVRERAFAALDRIEVVGLTEDLPRFLSDLRRRFRHLARGDASVVPVENAAPGREEAEKPDAEALALLRDLTRIDRDLHDEVRRRLRATG